VSTTNRGRPLTSEQAAAMHPPARTADGRWRKGGASPNPAGRAVARRELVERCRGFVDEHVVAAWEREIATHGDDWFRASELMAAYAYGRPSAQLNVSVTHRVEEMTTERILAEVQAAREVLALPPGD
jgi:hypothetical protein